MRNVIMRLKSGREIKFSCKSYKFERYRWDGTLLSFEYTGGIGECPMFFNVDDVEAIIEIFEESEEE